MADEQIDGQVYGRISGWMDGRIVDVWMNGGWVDGQKWVDGYEGQWMFVMV